MRENQKTCEKEFKKEGGENQAGEVEIVIRIDKHTHQLEFWSFSSRRWLVGQKYVITIVFNNSSVFWIYLVHNNKPKARLQL